MRGRARTTPCPQRPCNRLVRLQGPGRVLLLPIMDAGLKVDLRPETVEIPRQTYVTKNQASVDLGLRIMMRVMADHVDLAVLMTPDYRWEVKSTAYSALQAVINDIALDSVLGERERVSGLLLQRLVTETRRFGV
jgi:regulator of protease activity HflC (stomatin/prohibitin superfamily)